METKPKFFKDWIQTTVLLLVLGIVLWFAAVLGTIVFSRVHDWLIQLTINHWPHSALAGQWLFVVVLFALASGLIYAIVMQAGHKANTASKKIIMDAAAAKKAKLAAVYKDDEDDDE